MISAPDRQQAVALIEEAHRAGARWNRACAELGIDVRTYQRWTAGETVQVDGRPAAVRPEPANKLSVEERAQVLAVCHEPAYASLPPGQIVPRLADEGRYLASESVSTGSSGRRRSRPLGAEAGGPGPRWSRHDW